MELELINGDRELFERILSDEYGLFMVKDVIKRYVEFAVKCKKYKRGGEHCDWFYFYASKLEDATNLSRSSDDYIYMLARWMKLVVLDHPGSEFIYIFLLSDTEDAELFHSMLKRIKYIFGKPPLPEKVTEFLASFTETTTLEVVEKNTQLKFKIVIPR